MKCNLTVLFILAAALVVLVFAWIAAAQGNGQRNDDSSSVCLPCAGNSQGYGCTPAAEPNWYDSNQ